MAIGDAFRALVSALQGISTFAPPPFPGPQLSDASTHEVRKALGGALESIPQVRLRWYPPDIERAQKNASTGDMTMVGQLNESMKLDGVFRGLMAARTSVVTFPRRFYGSPEVVQVLESKNNSDRDVYSEMVPATEAALMAGDEINCGIAVGEMVPVVGRNFPVLIRRFPQNLRYLWQRDQWFYQSIVGMMPITPGVPDEHGNAWVLHIGGGRLAPWNNGLWNTLGRSYINKTQTLFARQSWEQKHAHPARVGFAPIGAAEEERKGFLAGLIRWALNPSFALPPGWDIKLVESNGRGIEVYENSIKTYNEEMATALCGSAVMLQGTTGFSNMDVFRVVQTDLIKTTSSAWDHTVNTQVLPAFIASRWGIDALKNATTVETDVAAPKDRKVEADTMVSLANAVKGLIEAMGVAQQGGTEDELVRLNVREILARYGIPTEPGKPAEVKTEPKAASIQKAARAEDAGGQRPAALCIVWDRQERLLCVTRPEVTREMAIPGGLVEEGEDAASAAVRELEEECGVRVQGTTLAAMLRSPTDGREVWVFVATSWSGTARAAEPDTAIAWLEPQELLAQSILFKSTVRQLMDLGVLVPPYEDAA